MHEDEVDDHANHLNNSDNGDAILLSSSFRDDESEESNLNLTFDSLHTASSSSSSSEYSSLFAPPVVPFDHSGNNISQFDSNHSFLNSNDSVFSSQDSLLSNEATRCGFYEDSYRGSQSSFELSNSVTSESLNLSSASLPSQTSQNQPDSDILVQNDSSNIVLDNAQQNLPTSLPLSQNGDVQNQIRGSCTQSRARSSSVSLLDDSAQSPGSEPLPSHWRTNSDRTPLYVSLPVDSSIRTLLELWLTKSKFPCRWEFENQRIMALKTQSILHYLDKILERASGTRTGVVDLDSLASDSIDNVIFPEEFTVHMYEWYRKFVKVVKTFANESNARNVLLENPYLLQMWLFNMELALENIIRYLPRSPMSFGVSLSILVSRALQRISAQRKFMQWQILKYVRESPDGTEEEAFRRFMDILVIFVEDMAFILIFARPALEPYMNMED